MTRTTAITRARMAMVRVFIETPIGSGQGYWAHLSPGTAGANVRARRIVARRAVACVCRRPGSPSTPEVEAPQVAAAVEDAAGQHPPSQSGVEAWRGPVRGVRRQQRALVRLVEEQSLHQRAPEATALRRRVDAEEDHLEVAAEPLVDHRLRPLGCGLLEPLGPPHAVL